MNEGWACYWHARLLREADFLSQQDYIDAIKTHSDVVRPHASGSQVSLTPNPYHLGFCMWEKIIDEHGIEFAFEVRKHDDDFSFIRNYLTKELAEELELFQYIAAKDGTVQVVETKIDELREVILASKYNFGAPVVNADRIDVDGKLHLVQRSRKRWAGARSAPHRESSRLCTERVAATGRVGDHRCRWKSAYGGGRHRNQADSVSLRWVCYSDFSISQIS